jgi:hypothetical protein
MDIVAHGLWTGLTHFSGVANRIVVVRNCFAMFPLAMAVGAEWDLRSLLQSQALLSRSELAISCVRIGIRSKHQENNDVAHRV